MFWILFAIIAFVVPTFLLGANYLWIYRWYAIPKEDAYPFGSMFLYYLGLLTTAILLMFGMTLMVVIFIGNQVAVPKNMVKPEYYERQKNSGQTRPDSNTVNHTNNSKLLNQNTNEKSTISGGNR